MKGLKNVTWDKALVALAIGYVTLPIVFFFFGWLKWPIALVLAAVFCFFAYKLYKDIAPAEVALITKETYHFWFWIVVLCGIWVYLSGIGSFVYQNGDHWARNAVFRDLCNYEWPVIYDLSEQREYVQSITGSGKVAFAYYLSWWLPVAGIVKLFSLPELVANALLVLWAALGVILTVYMLCRYLGKCTRIAPFMLIFFSGLDAIPYMLINQAYPYTEHIEWWAGFFQYSSNTTLLFFVFNQVIPTWLIVSLFLQKSGEKYSAGLASLTFAYSPWVTIGIVPFALASFFKGAKQDLKATLKKNINVANMAVPCIMLVIFGSYFLVSSGSDSGLGITTLFALYPDRARETLCSWIVFAFVEFLIYFMVMGKTARKYPYYWIVIVELIIFPIIVISGGDFPMRGTIPALFLTAVYIMKFFVEEWGNVTLKARRNVMIALMVVAMLTPLSEFNRVIINTMEGNVVIQEQVSSFGYISTDTELNITLTKNQFYVYDYEDTFFFKYLAK